MAIWKRVFRLLALFLGLVGSIACILALIVAWSVSARLCQATDKLFEKLESTVGDVQARLGRVRERLDESKVTTAGIAESLKSWTKREALEQVAVRLDLEKKTDRLASMLQQTDHWLELSGSACELVQRGLSIAASADAPVEPTRIDGLVEDITFLRAKLAETTEIVTRIRDCTAAKNNEKPVKRRIEQAVELVVRVAATVGIIDSRLDKFTDRLSQAKEDLRESKVRTIRRIRLATIAIMLLILWIGAGQVAISLYGCQGLRRRQAGRPPSA